MSFHTVTKLATICTKIDIINRLSTGESSNKIAKDYNVSGQRIRQIKKENQQLIEQKVQELLQFLPDVVETTKIDLEIAKKISLEGKKDLNTLTPEKLQFKAQTNKISADIYRAIGFYPAQAQSLFIQNIYNDNRKQTVISERYMKFLDSMAEEDRTEDIESKDSF
ncbi:MAG: hypothetical protein MRK02_15250 [Candidatus Scalindua sp.]|nr:hypothetical protein [Candidatus Scalindua sp.]